MILATSLIGYVRLDPQPDNRQVFDRVLVRTDPTDYTESLAIINIMTKLV